MFSKVGISSTNVGFRSRDTIRRGDKRLKSRKWKEAINTEFARNGLEYSVSHAGYRMDVMRLKLGLSLRKRDLKLERWNARKKGWWPKDSFSRLASNSSIRMHLSHG